MKQIKYFFFILFAVTILCSCDDDQSSGSIEGTWYLRNSSGCIAEVVISSTSCIITRIYDISDQNPMSTWYSGVKNGIVVPGTDFFRNLQKTGDTWTCHQMVIQYNPISLEAIGLEYHSAIMRLESDGSLFLAFTTNTSLRSGWLIRSGCGNMSDYVNKTGNIGFYIGEDLGCGSINVTLTGVGSGTIDRYFPSGAPDCDDDRALIFKNLDFGTYSFTASCYEMSWSGTVQLDVACHMNELLGDDNGGTTNPSKGSISFWINTDFGCGNIYITLQGVGSRTITQYMTREPNCGDPGTATFSNLDFGYYYFTASCQEIGWEGSILLDRNCVTMHLR
ncbi:MAG: hypothetical protein FWH18_08235 [Marinilabiliaceae bacterium]|nr:hypothetical protein [Marinilabiliaceae bacterium]